MAKRANTEGSLYQRKDKRWVGAFILPGGKRKSIYGTTRAEASTKLREAQHLASRGIVLADERTSVETFLAAWLDSIRASIRPRTLQGYRVNVDRHIVPELGRVRLARLTPDAIQLFMSKKLDSGLSPQTVRNIHATLRRALGQAVRWGVLPRNAASLVSPPRIQRDELKPMTVEEARTFLTYVAGDRLRALYSVAMLGLRQGEILGLRWQDADLDGGLLRIERTLQRYSNEYHLTEPKTARSRRTVPMPSAVVEALKLHRERQQYERKERLKVGASWNGGWNLVFCREDGGPLNSAVVTRHFQRAQRNAAKQRVEETGVLYVEERPLPFHALRHSAASIMIAQGVPLRTVMEVLGHSEIGTTANIYGHLTAELTRDATDQVGKAVWGIS